MAQHPVQLNLRCPNGGHEEGHLGILFLSVLGERQAEQRDKRVPFLPDQAALCLVSLHYSYFFLVWPFFF